jgi:hypothetical protein
MDNGWTRYVFCLEGDIIIKLGSKVSTLVMYLTAVSVNVWSHALIWTKSWLSQANHIFSRLGITSDFENYCVFSLHIGLTFASHLFK